VTTLTKPGILYQPRRRRTLLPSIPIPLSFHRSPTREVSVRKAQDDGLAHDIHLLVWLNISDNGYIIRRHTLQLAFWRRDYFLDTLWDPSGYCRSLTTVSSWNLQGKPIVAGSFPQDACYDELAAAGVFIWRNYPGKSWPSAHRTLNADLGQTITYYIPLYFQFIRVSDLESQTDHRETHILNRAMDHLTLGCDYSRS
jgi:hypothetical protein